MSSCPPGGFPLGLVLPAPPSPMDIVAYLVLSLGDMTLWRGLSILIIITKHLLNVGKGYCTIFWSRIEAHETSSPP